MEIVNKRRALGIKLDTIEVNKRLLLALQPWNQSVCNFVREKENFKNFSTDEVLGRLLTYKERDEEATRVNNLLGQGEEEKKEIALKASHEANEKKDKKKKKKEIDSSDEDSDNEMALLVRRFKSFLKKDGYKKKSYDKSKARRSKRTCYECGDEGYFIAECPNKKSKEERRKDKHHKKDKKYKKHRRGEAHIGQNGIPMVHPLPPPNLTRMREALLHSQLASLPSTPLYLGV
ncbi:hypothetical protein QOZ80_9BG0702890 [Eleusine coracana subsp. coracana]|nr:hypothetical protein QOZ80_9BG0702890 [Eleusine coracana subsp. coracana]